MSSKKIINKCIAFTKGCLKRCDRNINVNSKSTIFCGTHFKQYEQFNQAEYEQLPMCPGDCKLKRCLDNKDKPCQQCLDTNLIRIANRRTRLAEAKVACLHPNCSNQCRSVENKYCGQHQKNLFPVENGRRKCQYYTNGCNCTIISTSNRISCVNCMYKNTINTPINPNRSATLDQNDSLPEIGSNCQYFTVIHQNGNILYYEPGIVTHNECSNIPIDESNFCQKHQYLSKFTPDEYPYLRKCNGCSTFINPFKNDNKGKSCSNCHERTAIRNRKSKKARADTEKCRFYDPFRDGLKCHNRSQDSEFCLIHQRLKGLELDQLCFNFVRCCYNLKSKNSNFCEKCVNDCETFHQKYPLINTFPESCKKCKRSYNPYIINNRLNSIHCQHCFQSRQKQESARHSRNRDWKKEYQNMSIAKKEQIKARLQDLRINHPKMFRKHWIKYRLKKFHELGESEYRRLNNETMKLWREKNQNLLIDTDNSSFNLSPDYKLTRYKSYSKSKNIEWTLSDNEAIKLFYMCCFYCKYKHPTKLNGIDKINYLDGYKTDNVLPCCKICNMMKKCLEFDIFILRCKHIISFVLGDEIPNPAFFPKSSYDSLSIDTYEVYRSSAILRQISFDLTEPEFNKLKSENCYLCGKENNLTHQNGIDRIDNQLGYIVNNCAACCASCNYMKHTLNLTVFLNQCYLISLIYDESFEGLSIDENLIGGKNIKSHLKDKKQLVNCQKTIVNESISNNIHPISFEEELELKLNQSVQRSKDKNDREKELLKIQELSNNTTWSKFDRDLIIKANQNASTLNIVESEANLDIQDNSKNLDNLNDSNKSGNHQEQIIKENADRIFALNWSKFNINKLWKYHLNDIEKLSSQIPTFTPSENITLLLKGAPHSTSDFTAKKQPYKAGTDFCKH